MKDLEGLRPRSGAVTVRLARKLRQKLDDSGVSSCPVEGAAA